MGKSILFVANVCKEHILKFHIPTIRALKEDGWTVDVACSGDEVVPYCDHQYHLSWKRSPFSPKFLVGIKELKNIIKNNHYDIIYCHTPVGGLAARIAGRKARKTGTKVIYFAHGFHFYKGAPPQNWIVFFLLEKCLAQWTDYLITINEEDYQYAFKKKMYQKEVFKVPGIGINFDRLQEPEGTNWRSKIRDEFNIGDSDIVLTYVAEIILNKNQGKLIDVIDVLSEKYPKIKLLLVGPEHDGGKFALYAEKKSLKDKVVFTGWRDDIGAFLYASDIIVASSIREGLPLNLIEALACGRPVVAFDNRGHREIVKNGVNGYLVNMDDVNAMVKKIELILEKEYVMMSKNAIESSQKYDQKVVAQKLVQLLNSLEMVEKNRSVCV